MSEEQATYDVAQAQAVIEAERNQRAAKAAADLNEFLQGWRKRWNADLQNLVQTVPGRDGYGFVLAAVSQVVAL